MSKKQRLLNAVKTLNLTLEQRQELVEAIEDFGGSSGKILNMSIGILETDIDKQFLEINNVKVIGDGELVAIIFTKDELFKMFNISNIFDISIYNGINAKIHVLSDDHIVILNEYYGINISIIPDVDFGANRGDHIQFKNGNDVIIDIKIIENNVQFTSRI